MYQFSVWSDHKRPVCGSSNLTCHPAFQQFRFLARGIPLNRRNFLLSAAAAGAAFPLRGWAAGLQSPFRISVINDEISPDFDHACSVAANDFGMSWIELRSMWGKNVTELSDDQ